MGTQFEISQEEVDILTRYYGDVHNIMKNLDDVLYSHQNHLGGYYVDTNSFSSKDQKVLADICQNGIANVTKTTDSLVSAGVITYKGKGYWENNLNRLNYQLGLKIQCIEKTVPQEVVDAINHEKAAAAAAE